MERSVPESLDPDVVRFLQARLPEWMRIDREVGVGGRARSGMISARDASRQLGLSTPTVGEFLKEGKGGLKFMRAVARLRYGKEDLTRLEEDAKAWVQTQQPSERSVVPEDIDRVLAIAERLDRSAAEARRVVEKVAAYKGSATDEEIAQMFEADAASGTVVTSDDLGGGIGDAKHSPARRRARK